MVKIETTFTIFYYKMFQPIEINELKLREKYKIVGKCEYYGTFTGLMSFPDSTQYFIFVNVCNQTNNVYVPSKLFLTTCLFKKFVSQKEKIQSDMERRAVNLLIRRIVGDNHFTW